MFWSPIYVANNLKRFLQFYLQLVLTTNISNIFISYSIFSRFIAHPGKHPHLHNNHPIRSLLDTTREHYSLLATR